MLHFLPRFLCLLGLGTLAGQAMASPACRPFVFYRKLPLPALPPSTRDAPESAVKGETSLLAAIVARQGRAFAETYESWQASPATKSAWLECVYPYLLSDTDGDGLPDWTAIVDEAPSRLLVPSDADIDGDGVDNILDPQPFLFGDAVSAALPDHLAMAQPASSWEDSLLDCGKDGRLWQARLFDEYGLVALDHSDEHAPCVLETLMTILQVALPRSFVQECANFRYIYAFAGHDERQLIAAYHRQMQAISVGGVQTYRRPLTRIQRVHLLSALAHEIGHAFLFCAYQPRELAELAERHAAFPALEEQSALASFYDETLLRPHPRREHLLNAASVSAATSQDDEGSPNLVSSYALANQHEWFAEAFAAYVLRVLGEKGELGGAWQSLIALANQESSDAWTDYARLSESLAALLARKLGRMARTN